jgi:hypothetical protein
MAVGTDLERAPTAAVAVSTDAGATWGPMAHRRTPGFRAPVPAALWTELKAQRLLREDAPI